MVKDHMHRLSCFLDSYEKCMESKSTSTFENYQLEYVVGSSPLPSSLYVNGGMKEKAYIIVSKKSTHCIQNKKKSEENEDEMIAINTSSLYPYIHNANEIIVFNEECKNDISTDYFNETIRPPCMDTHFSSTGSPLELRDYQTEIMLEEENVDDNVRSGHRLPVKCHEASFLISFYNIGVAKKLKEKPNFAIVRLWVLSDASDYIKTIYTSSLLTLNNENAHESGIKKDNCIQNKCYSVSSIDVTCKKYQHNDDEETPTKSFLAPSLSSSQNLEMEYESTYLLYRACSVLDIKANNNDVSNDMERTLKGQLNHSNSISKEDPSFKEGMSSVKVVVDWCSDSCLFSTPPLVASATLAIEVVDGHNPEVSNMHHDLLALQRMVKGLDESEVEWHGGLVDGESVKERIGRLIDGSCKNKHKIHITGHEGTQTSMTDNSVYKVKMTRKGDFVDQVWSILRDCTEYNEMVESVKCIFTALQNKLIQPSIQSSNKTTLAQIIRQSQNGSIQKEVYNWLRDNRPLLLVIEIGIEKLKMDYLNIFLECRLVQLTDLAFYLGCVDFESVDVKLHKLIRLHHILELNLLLDLHTTFPRSLLSQALKQSLLELKEGVCAGVKVPILLIDIFNLLEKSLPTEWKCIARGNLTLNRENYINNSSNDKVDGGDTNGDCSPNGDNTMKGDNIMNGDNKMNGDTNDETSVVGDDVSLVYNCIHMSGLCMFPHLSDVHDDVNGLCFKQKYWQTSLLQNLNYFPL